MRPRPSPRGRSDAIRFLPRALFVVIAAIVAEAVGATGALLVREFLGIGPIADGTGERALFILFAVPPAAIVLSIGIAGRRLASAEAVVALIAVGLSFWLGPILFALGDRILASLLPAVWPDLARGSELAHDPFWAAAIALVAAPAEFYVWQSMAPVRLRERYRILSELATTSEPTAGDRRQASSLVASLRLFETRSTARLVGALDAWGAAFTSGSSGLDVATADSLVREVDAAMAELYGRS